MKVYEVYEDIWEEIPSPFSLLLHLSLYHSPLFLSPPRPLLTLSSPSLIGALEDDHPWGDLPSTSQNFS